uniref:Uncharacterized protein n=1 Tax=Panagrolaimus davidi TaxID=227884 RepID=A0A914Q512_9BILA
MFFLRSSPTNITFKTVKELLKLPHFLTLDSFHISDIPDKFDIESFYIYMKKNKQTKVYLNFDDSISEAYKIRLEDIIQEIIATEKHDYAPPFIMFLGQIEGNEIEMLNIFRRYYKSSF